MANVKIAWLQYPFLESISDTFAFVLEQCEEALQQGAELVFLPELAIWSYFPQAEDTRFFDDAILLKSPQVQKIQELAKKYKSCLFFPFFEKRGEGLFQNSVVAIGAEGEILEVYRKMHIPDDPGFSEKYYFTPSQDGFKVVQTPKLKVGLLICWDQWFPEAARLSALQGAELLYYPTAIGWDKKEPTSIYEQQLDSWLTVNKANAITNGCFSLAVNRIGQEGELTFWGNSFLTSPTGQALHNSLQNKEIALQSIDLSSLSEQRRAWPFFRDRRVDHYQNLSSLWLDS